MGEMAVVRRDGGGGSFTPPTHPSHAPVGLSRTRPDLRWLLTALALVVVLAVPFCLVDLPPVLDYPNHLARYVMLAHPDDPVLSQIYAPRWAVLPNLGMDVLAAGLLRVTSVHVGGRLLLALSLFAPIVGVIVYHRAAFGRFSYWPLASGLIAYNGIFFLGFLNFLLSLGMALGGAAIWILLSDRGFRFVAAAAGAVCAALIFFCHIFGVAFFAMLIGAREADRLWRMQRSGALNAADMCRTGASIALALSPAIALYLASPLMNGAADVAGWGGLHKLWDLVTPVMIYSKALTALTALVLFTLLVLTWRGASVAPGIPLVLLALLVALIAAPLTIKSGTFVDNRLAMMIGLLLFAGFQPRFVPRYAAAIAGLLAALIGVRVAYVGSVWLDHRRDLAEVRAAIGSVEPGARVLPMRGRLGLRDQEPANRALPGIERLDTHLAALLLIERKAFWPFLFADPTQQPMMVKPPYDQLARALFDPLPWAMLSDDMASVGYAGNWRANFDYVLLIDAPAEPGAMPRGLTLVGGGAYARLYRVSSPP